jgi:hypothetical protein
MPRVIRAGLGDYGFGLLTLAVDGLPDCQPCQPDSDEPRR